jgi:imidazolonepropionase-like amidohydrolase
MHLLLAAALSAQILIRHVTVVDVEHARAIPDQAIVTAANEILAVGSDATIAKSWQADQTLDGRGRFVIPGLSLAAATRAGPACFDKLDRYGSLAKGKAADLVLLDRNPLQDIAVTRAIHAVILRGKLYDRAALDRMLDETRDKVKAWNAEATN